MQTIYVDVLIVLNIYVNYFLLRITSGITRSPLKNRRCIAASAYGSIFSLSILAPELNSIIVTSIKLAAAVTIVMLAFGIHGKKRLFINTSAFFVSNIVLAGMIYAVYSWLSPEFVHIGNSFFYIDFSLIILVASTAALYIIVCPLRIHRFQIAIMLLFVIKINWSIYADLLIQEMPLRIFLQELP